MIDNEVIQQAVRTRLETLSVVDTGSVALGASGTAYTRSTGSFWADGFRPGMELIASGFSEGVNNDYAVVVAVDALALTIDQTLVAEVEGAGKRIQVGLPRGRSWENLDFTPTTGSPYVSEQFISGPVEQLSIGDEGVLEYDPLYSIQLQVPENDGAEGASRYADAIFRLFKPNTKIVLSTGDTLRVRLRPAPFRGQLVHNKPGWATVPVTVPLRLHTINN